MENKLGKIGGLCFWAALMMELLIVMVDKSAYINPYESMLFRLTFLLFCIKIVTTKYSRGEWLCIIAFGVIAAAAYFVNERDETVRAVVLVAACKNVDLRKMLKTILTVTAIGSVVLFALSAAGVFGDFSVTANFGRGSSGEGIVETRYCFGMGHPNAFQVMLFMMSTVCIYLYAAKMKLVHFFAVGAVNIAFYLFTDSNTSLIVMMAVIAGVILLKYSSALRESKVMYFLGAALFIAVVIFSAYGSHVGRYGKVMRKLDKILNGRFQYAWLVKAARVENWKLFGDAANIEFFDQGFVRLFYWYGIIIGLIYIAANLYLIWQSYKKRDYCLLVIVVSYAVLSIMEAHLVSVYLLRNYLLIWLGYYWTQPFWGKNDREAYNGEAYNGEVYFWQLKQLLNY